MKKRLVTWILGALFAAAMVPAVCVSASEEDISSENIKSGQQNPKSTMVENMAGDPIDGIIPGEELPENLDLYEPGVIGPEDEEIPESDMEEQKPEVEDAESKGETSVPNEVLVPDEIPVPDGVPAPDGVLQDEEQQHDVEETVEGIIKENGNDSQTDDASTDTEPSYKSEFVKTSEGTFYYDAEGKKVTGQQKIGDYHYYFDSNGKMQTGFCTSGKKRYYYDEDGRMVTGKKTIGKYKYYFKSDGSAYTSWRTESKKKYYYDSEGRMSVGSKKIGKSLYYFKKNGVMHKNGFYTDKKNKYYADKKGRLITGTKKIGKYTYYFRKSTGVMQKGFLRRGKSTYYFDGKGHRVKGAKKIKGKWYYFENNGKRTKSKAKIYAIKVLDKLGWSLRTAFNYSAYSLRYVSTGWPPKGSSHTDWYAIRGFENKSGNCYVMAATFVQMARVLGYSAYLVEGSVPSISGGYTPHGWCEIVVKGTMYVCDPDFTHETGRNGYMIRYRQPGTWVYAAYRRVK